MSSSGMGSAGPPPSPHGASSDVTSFHTTSDAHQYNFQQQPPQQQSTKSYLSAEHNAFNRLHPEEHQPQNIQEESRLLRKLLNGYDRRVRPVIKASTKVNASIGITLTQIFDMVRKIELYRGHYILLHISQKSLSFTFSIKRIRNHFFL